MKTTYRRLVRHRLEAAFRIRIRRGPEPVMNPPMEPLPAEFIDVSSGAFTQRFPQLAAERKGRR